MVATFFTSKTSARRPWEHNGALERGGQCTPCISCACHCQVHRCGNGVPSTILYRFDTVEYRSASRIGESDGDINRKRIKAIREALQTKGWRSTGF
jgi:hypothetical protein